MRLTRYFVLFICCFGLCEVFGNNVKISSITYRPREVTAQNDILHLSFTISWNHAWKDDYNHDAVYVFLKYRKRANAGQEWHPMYIESCRTTDSRYSCELAEGAVEDGHIGFYVYLNQKGNGSVEIPVEVSWNIKSNSRGALTFSDINRNAVLMSAFGIEMVRVPRGPFRAGDNLKENKVFWRDYVPFPTSADLINSDCNLYSPSGDPYKAADHVGGSVGDTTSCWIPAEGTGAEWEVDFGANKIIRYLGICATQNSAVPKKWRLEAQASLFDDPVVIFEKSSSDWIVATNSAYPSEQTIATGNTKAYSIYRLVFEDFTGTLAIKSISMTDVDNPLIKDHTVLVDRDSLILESKRSFGAQDGTAWNSGAVVKSDYPNGYQEFYAMKYELTQEQYVSFLNTLTWAQQQALIPGLAAMEEGEYIFGPRRDTVNCRNGIIVERKVTGAPMVFANNLNPKNLPGNDDDGQTLACNYLSLKDLQAYAAWSGLRPMTELEFEKLGRPLYDYTAIPQVGEYAWNSLGLEHAGNLRNVGSSAERADGNANYNGVVGGPLRNGVFAGSETANREGCGVSYWGVFELSGNLAEPYYNVNAAGRVFKGKDFIAGHGNGYLTAAALPEAANVAAWPAGPAAFALRGGHFGSTDVKELAVSDRRYFQNYWKDVNERDSTVGIRLGRRCPAEEVLEVVNTLTLLNGEVGSDGHIVYDTINDGENYIVSGSGAADVGATYCVLWSKSEDDSQDWTLMEGFTDKDLNLPNVIGRFGEGGKMREYRYRRKIVTPQGESMAQIGLRVVDPTYEIDKSKATYIFGTTNHGITVTSQSTNLVVKWIDIKTGVEYPPTTETDKSSYFRLDCSYFNDFQFGEDRPIAVHMSIYNHIFHKDTIVYKVPMPSYSFDKTEVVIGTGTEGIRVTSDYLVNIVWRDIKSNKPLLNQDRVLTSFCHPVWGNFDNPSPNEVRPIEVTLTSTDGCYVFKDTVNFIMPDCAIDNPFGSTLVQTFSNGTGSTNTLQVTHSWGSNIPKRWDIEGARGGISINTSGVLSGLSGTICNVVVTLVDQRCPDIVHKKTVKETSREYAYTGSYKSVRLSGGTYQLECYGAQGGTGQGGYGGYARGNYAGNSQTLYLYVGGQNGWNGGGSGHGRASDVGGGMTDIRSGSTGISYQIIVAGGGGGKGPSAGGSGGGVTGGNGSGSRGGGEGGQSNRGGKGGGGGSAGGRGYGGSNSYGSKSGGGGGGGGYYGGGAGGNDYPKYDDYDDQGGGGGSGYIGGVQDGYMSNGSRSGNGLIRITVK